MSEREVGLQTHTGTHTFVHTLTRNTHTIYKTHAGTQHAYTSRIHKYNEYVPLHENVCLVDYTNKTHTQILLHQLLTNAHTHFARGHEAREPLWPG